MKPPLRLLLAPLAALAAVLVFVLPGAATGAPAGGLQATLTAAGGTTVRLELQNDGTATAYVPTWLTGARGIGSPILTVAHDGAPVAYTGMLAKRDEAPGADDLAIEPGASRGWTVDVGTAYAVPTGASMVTYEVTTPEGVSITSNTVAIAASRPAPRPYALAPSGIGAAAITFTGCSDAERAQINTAVTAANTYAAYASAYLAAGGQGMRYTNWFGTYLSARWNTVQSHYAAIQAVTGGSSLAFTCHDAGCGASTYAFVYPGAPYMVYVCSEFWNAANTGTDSRAGTLIHEISHFTVVAGTADHVYGQSDAQALAISSPAQAVSNADNHEYFAEDNPVAQSYSTYANPAASYNLGTTPQGSSSSATQITITSAGTTALHPTGVSVTGDYLVTTDTCTGATLAQGATCHLDVVFVPSATGTRTGTVALLGATISPAAIALSGIGSSPAPPTVLYSTPAAAYDLGPALVGTSTSGTAITVTSTGTGTLHPTGATITGDFAITANTCTGASLAPSATCYLNVAFQPTATGTRSGTLSLLGDLTSNPVAVTLTGTGTAPVPEPDPTPSPAPSPTPAPASTPVAAPVESAPAATPAVMPAAPATLKAASSCRVSGGCAVTGTMPAGATAVRVHATRTGGSARGTCKVIAGRYSCALRLGKGTWTVVTEATGPDGVVARSSKKVVR